MMNPRRLLFFIISIGFLVRVAVCFLFHLPHRHTDTFMYYDQAAALIKGGYINYAPNGFPGLIALVEKVFNTSNPDYILLGMNILMGTCSIIFVYVITEQLFKNHYISIVAAILMALYPNQVSHTRWILTEVPCTFFILGAYYTWLNKQRLWSGIFLGISVLFRPTLLPVGLCLLLYQIFRSRRIPFSFITGITIPLLGIALFSYVKIGKFSITGNETVNVVYAVSSYTARTNGEIDWDAPKRHPEIQTSAQARKLYFQHAVQDPVLFVKQRLASFWELWGFFPSSMNGTRGVGARLFIGLFNLFLISGSVFCIIKTFFDHRVLFLLFPVLSLTFIHVMLVSLARYTVPMEPYLIILTSWTIYHFGRLKMVRFQVNSETM